MNGRGHHHRRGARRDVRELLLAALLHGDAHGYELIRRLEDASGGEWRPSPGSIYPNLQLLEEEGLVAQRVLGDGRRIFTLTEEGRVRADADRLAALAPTGAEAEQRHELRLATNRLLRATEHLSGTATAAQVARAVTVIEDARRGLYALLQED